MNNSREILDDRSLNKVINKPSDLWLLGNHRLLCEDSTKIENIENLMNNRKADLVFTDPPYLLATRGGQSDEIGARLQRQGKALEFTANFEPQRFLDVLPFLFHKNMNAYIFCNKSLLPQYLNFAVEHGYSYNILIWKKPNPIPIKGSHWPDVEYLLLFRENAIWNGGLEGVNYSRCLQFPRVRKSEEFGNHPTVKPIKLVMNEIKISSRENGIVVDPFGGSGTTLIACEQLNRKCYMMEIDPKYCDVIIRRWQKLTGQQAILESNGKSFEEINSERNNHD